jgi:acyl carrier protein
MADTALTNEILDLIAVKAMVERNTLVLDAKLSDLSISSLDVVEIVFALEDKFAIELPFNANSQNQEFDTLGQVIALVEKQIALKKNPAA